MKRYTTRHNSFNPRSRRRIDTPAGSQLPPRDLRSTLRSGLDALHDHLFVSIVILGICLFAAWYIVNQRQTSISSKTSSSADSSNAPVLEKGKPDYDTVVPKGRTASSIDWTRVSPPDHNPVYTYIDTIAKATINVSEQPIPDDFKANPVSSVETLASNYNANQKILVGTDTVYIGTSEKGPQSVIFIKNNVLVLIKTDSRLSTDQWMSYISSLQ